MIGFYVTHWNRSSDTKLKRLVSIELMADYASDVQNGVMCIRKIVDHQFYKYKFEPAAQDLANKSAKAIALTECPKKTMTEQGRITDQMNADVAFYFAEMFKQGYLEQIPIPKFLLSLDHHNQCSDTDQKVEEVVARAGKMISKLPDDLKITYPPEQPENSSSEWRSDTGIGGHDED